MTALISKVVRRWSASGIIKESDEDVYEYGLELIVCTILNLTAILLTAALMGKIKESVILIAAIIPLQAYGGGYHAKTHLRCFLIMYIGWWAAVFILPFISSVAATVIMLASMPVVFMLAPVPHVNIEMSEGHRLKLRVFVRAAALCIAVVAAALIWVIPSVWNIGIAFSTGLGIAALSMMVAHFANAVKA